MYYLVPNISDFEHNLEKFAEIVEADEVLLFEKATFLVSGAAFYLSMYLSPLSRE